MSIKTSKANLPIIERLKQTYDFKYFYVPARIAIAYSMQLNQKFDLSEFGTLDNGGKEIDEKDIFGGREQFTLYHSLFNQHYGRILDNAEFLKLAKIHMDFGLERLGKEILDADRGRFAHVDYLISIIKKGMTLLNDDKLTTQTSPLQVQESPSLKGLVDFELGETEDGEKIVIRLNDLNEFKSHHIAFAGMNGSGKTELIKDVLFQIAQKTDQQLKFIYFDYKGEGRSDKLKPFLEKTGCRYLNPLETPWAFNPLSFINLTNERYQIFNINAFVDAIAAIEPKLGAKQKNSLKTVITNCIEERKDGSYPTLENIFNELENYYDTTKEKPDILYAHLKDLASGIFTNPKDPRSKIYHESLYLSLPAAMSDKLRQLCVFLTLNYLLNEFLNFNDVVPDGNMLNPLRYVVVIDEAHIYLNNNNARGMLEKMLRLIRSKGVVVVMISQGTEDYHKSDFNFADEVKITVCLDVKNKNPKVVERFLGTVKSDVKFKKALDGLTSSKAITNLGEPKLIGVRQFWRTVKGE